MLILSMLLLLLSNAVTLRRDKSILYSRIAIIILLYSSLLGLVSLYIKYIDKGIGLYGGLFHITSNTQIFHIFIFLMSASILQLSSFSSCFILLGTCLLYANSGTTNLDGLYVITSLSDMFNDNTNNILY